MIHEKEDAFERGGRPEHREHRTAEHHAHDGDQVHARVLHSVYYKNGTA